MFQISSVLFVYIQFFMFQICSVFICLYSIFYVSDIECFICLYSFFYVSDIECFICLCSIFYVSDIGNCSSNIRYLDKGRTTRVCWVIYRVLQGGSLYSHWCRGRHSTGRIPRVLLYIQRQSNSSVPGKLQLKCIMTCNNSSVIYLHMKFYTY